MVRLWFQILLIMTATAANTIPRWSESHAWYYEGQAVSILLWLFAARNKTKHAVINLFWEWCILLAINNVIDELFGDPKEVSVVEVSVSIIITLWTLYKITKCSKHIQR